MNICLGRVMMVLLSFSDHKYDSSVQSTEESRTGMGKRQFLRARRAYSRKRLLKVTDSSESSESDNVSFLARRKKERTERKRRRPPRQNIHFTADTSEDATRNHVGVLSGTSMKPFRSHASVKKDTDTVLLSATNARHGSFSSNAETLVSRLSLRYLLDEKNHQE